MRINFASLKDAVGQLERSVGYLHGEFVHLDPGLREQFRASTIQAFEFTYELAVKMIDRQMSQIVANPKAYRGMDFADRMREAADAGVICDPQSYVRYREFRNRTSHTYNVKWAKKTVSAVHDFLEDVRFLLRELGRRNP